MVERRALLAPALALALLPTAVRAAWQVSPSVDVRETWSDNPSLQPDNRKHSQFITTVSPGVTVTNQSPRLQVTASYQLNAFAYSDDRVTGSDRFNSSLSASARGTVVHELLYFDAAAGIAQTPVSAFGPVSDNPYSSTNRSEVRSWRVSPYLVHAFGALATGQVRYAHDMVDSDAGGFARSTSDTLDLSLNSGPSFRTLGWGAQLSREKVDDSLTPAAINSKALVSLRYLLTRQFTLTATSGYDKFDYESNGQSTQGASWSAGFMLTPSTRTSLTMSAGRRYYGNSYFVAASHRSRSTVWTINYSDNVSTSRSNFLLPSAVDTAAMLSQLFTANIPDPVQRARAVEAYIRALNLPRSLPNSVNYLSNRYMLQRQLNASMAWRSARTTALVSVYRTRREALSLLQYDSSLLGSGIQNVNDSTDQTGLSLMADYRFSGRTSAALSANISRSESRSGNLDERNRYIRAHLTRNFSPKLSGSVELRRTSGGFALEGGSYKENAVGASLSMKF